MSESDIRQEHEPALIRLFIGIAISDDVRGRLTEVRDTLRKTRSHVGWVPPRNYHLSLAFLGDTPREMVTELGEAIDDAATCGPFTFRVTGVGVFGRPHSPRVIWAGVDAPRVLDMLYGNLRDNLSVLGFPTDNRPFRAHITLGRVRSSRGRSDLASSLADVRETAFGEVDAATIHLYRSVLLPGGAVYSVLHKARRTVRQ